MPPKRRASSTAQRVRSLIALDATNVVERLGLRREEMVALFSRLRDRGPLLAAIESWFPSATFAELASLEPHEQRGVSQFYELLGELRWYARYTEDMPLQVAQKIDRLIAGLAEGRRLLLAVLEAPVSKGKVVEVTPAKGAMQPRGRARKAR